MNPMNLDSIFKNVTIYGNISIKHRVHVFKETKTKEQVEYYKVFTSSKSKGGSNGIPSVSFRGTDDCIILENIPKEINTVKVKPAVYLTYGDIADVKRIFKEATSWFTEYKNDLFNYENSVPYSVSSKYQTLSTIMYPKIGIKGTFLAIQPAVIMDPMHGIGYPGVIFKGLSGIIGVCTYTEFLSMQTTVVSLLTNLYEISNNLINQYLMLRNLKGGQ